VKSLWQAAEQVVRCNKCGFCQEVCPTYKVTGQEFAVARGRNRLMRLVVDGRLALEGEPELKEYLYTCLLCGACTVVCPSGVPTDKLVAAARADLTRRQGLPFLYRTALHGVLRSPRRVAVPMTLLRLYQNSGVRWVARHTGLLRLFGTLGQVEGILPGVPRSSLRARLRARGGTAVYGTPAGGPGSAPRRRVAYFLGCVTDNLFPPVGEALIGVLERNGYQVVVPENMCCGVAHRAYGDLAAAEELARQNLAILAGTGADLVVTDCATCAHTLREYVDLLADDPRHAAAAAELSGKVREVSQLLVEEGFQEPTGVLEDTVTYHDPCHLSRGMGVRTQPRQILRSIPGLQFRELPEADWCCGGAGSYNVTHHGLSVRILERKMDNFRETGARLLATSCPSCLLQLGFGLRRAGLGARVVHPVQLLWQSYRNGG
jgi:glycolate oxidase iron-sulfur subunit